MTPVPISDGEAMDKYYVIKITLRQREFFLLWNDDREPVFLTGANGGAVFFGGMDELNAFAESNGLLLFEDIFEYDLDDIAVTAETLDCNEINTKWNIISDFALSVGAEFSGEDKRYNDIYNKLFYGCNLPAMKHHPYTPEWSDDEIVGINRVLAEGAELFARFLIK